MTFEYCYILNGNDDKSHNAPYQAQIPVYLVYKVTTTATTVRFLRWTVYWYEKVSETTTARKERTMTLTYTTGTQVFENNAYVPEPFIDIQKVTYSSNKPKLVVELMEWNDNVVEKDEFEFEIYGQAGVVNWDYDFPQPYADRQYPIIGEEGSYVTSMKDYKSTSSGTPLVWREAYEKFGKGEWAKLMLIRGTDQALDIDVAKQRGYISNSWDINSYVNHDEDFLLPFWYIATLYLRGGFLREGDYKLVIAYYEKNGSEFAGYYTLRTMESPQFRIYKPFSGANMHISSVVPAEYKEGDSDPNNGMPPFVVTVADDTSRTEYDVPLSSITIEWGDPDSGVNNAWSIIEPGTSRITIPPHTYNGYGPYNILMTCVDKRGGTSTKSVQFAPSKVPRVMKNPTLNGKQPNTTVTGTQPLLVDCASFIGGLPLPDVKWSFALRNESTDYYSGEKEGQYAELSLLAAGTYDVTCEIKNNDTVLLSASWIVSVSPSPTYQDTPIPANDYDIWICHNGERIDYFRPTRCQVVLRHAHSSYCEFDVPINHRSISYLLPDGELIIGCDGKARLMRITEFSESSDGLTVTIRAIDAASAALSSRVATLATNSTSGNGYDVQTCSAEALMRYFAISNIRSGNRVIPRLRVVDTNADRGGRVTYSARYESIIDIIEDICSQSGLGWDSSLQSDNPQTFSFKVVSGMVRTSTSDTPVIFTAKSLGSARLGSYSSLSGSNVAIAAGKGNGDSRQYSEYGETSESDLSRKEVFVDAGDSADSDEVECMANIELSRQEEWSISVYPNEYVYKFGVDYNLGDYVSVITRSGLVLDAQIIQATFSRDETGEVLTLECGTDMRSYQRMLREQRLANTYSRK